MGLSNNFFQLSSIFPNVANISRPWRNLLCRQLARPALDIFCLQHSNRPTPSLDSYSHTIAGLSSSETKGHSHLRVRLHYSHHIGGHRASRTDQESECQPPGSINRNPFFFFFFFRMGPFSFTHIKRPSLPLHRTQTKTQTASGPFGSFSSPSSPRIWPRWSPCFGAGSRWGQRQAIPFT